MHKRTFALDIAVELLQIEAETSGEFADLFLFERRLLFVEPVVHFPEPALFSSRFRDP